MEQTAIPYGNGVYLVPLEGIPVALGGFLILLVRALEQTIHMPAFIRVEETLENTFHREHRELRYNITHH